MTQGVLTFTGDSIYLITEIDVIHFPIDEVGEEIPLSDENYSQLIIVWTVAKTDLDSELSSSGEYGEDELAFSPISTWRGGSIVHPFASHSEWF